MVVHDLNVKGIRTVPAEADAPLVVDADAVLARSAAFQRLQPVARGHRYVSQANGSMQLEELAPARPLYTGRKASSDLPVENLRGLRTGEALNHSGLP